MNNVKQFKKYYHGMIVKPTPSQAQHVVNNIIYLFRGKFESLENK
jgi:hypothetical protein